MEQITLRLYHTAYKYMDLDNVNQQCFLGPVLHGYISLAAA